MNNEDVAVHFVEKPTAGEHDFYRQTVSFNAFKERELEQFHKKWTKKLPTGRHFYWQSKEEYESELCIMSALALRVDGLPVYHHKSVWDFYKAIGYDYKKKRFV